MTSFTELVAQRVRPPEQDAWTPVGYIPTPRQQAFHKASRERVDAILYGGARGGGKGFPFGELIPTHNGYTKVADINVGDVVLGRDGRMHTVFGVYDLGLVEGYRFTFDDGSEVVTNDEHLWLTFDQAERAKLLHSSPEWRERRRASRKTRGPGGKRSEKFSQVAAERNRRRALEHQSVIPTGTVRTTAEIVATLETGYGQRSGRGDKNHAIPVCGPIQLPERDLPIDPYVLGVWLGDGSSAGGWICSGLDDAAEMRALLKASSTVERDILRDSVRIFYLNGLRRSLRSVGLLDNKHVPHDYLWASYDQRLALLQGLLDTDGNCTTNGAVEFVNTNQSLTEAVAHLARSLGIKVHVREGRAKLYGKDCGPTWKVKFTTNLPVFRLQRKAERLPKTVSQRTQFRYIVKAERTPAEPMKCLRVSSPDSLFLVTEHFIPTHNTAALLMEAFWWALNVDKINILCARRTYPELEESFIRELNKRDYKNIGARWNQTAFRLKFRNGSTINFTYAETEKDMSRLRGGEYQLVCVDEASLMQQVVLEQFEELLRSGSRGVPVVGLRLASNPGGAGHQYLKSRFITSTNYGKYPFVDEHSKINLFVPAKVADNPHLDSAYHKRLEAITDPVRRAAMLDGDWSVVESAFFPQWRVDKHVVPRFHIPKDWQRYAGVDYGYAAPFACIWGAVDNDGRVWIYREAYVAGANAEQQAHIILEHEQASDEESVVRVADPSMWGERGTPLTIADVYGQQGVGLLQANNDRLSGWARFHWYLNDGIMPCEYHRELGYEFCPMLHVFADECPNFVEEIANLPRDLNDPDKAQTRNVADHAMDASRYMLLYIGNYCYSADTEVLTDQGWLPFSVVDIAKHRFATRNPKTKILEFQEATHQYVGQATEMVAITSKLVDMLVTPNHRLLLSGAPRGVQGDPWGDEVFVPAAAMVNSRTTYQKMPLTALWAAEDLESVVFGPPVSPVLCEICSEVPPVAKGRCGSCYAYWKRNGTDRSQTIIAAAARRSTRRDPSIAATPNKNLYKGRRLLFTGDQFAAFMGMYLSEGWVTYHGTPRRPTIGISQQTDSKGFVAYQNLLTEVLGREPYYNGHGWTFRCKELAEFLHPLGHAHQKTVPAIVKNMSAKQLEIFWTFYLLGDGHTDTTKTTITTVSSLMADDLQEIALKIGLSASITKVYPKRDVVINDKTVLATSLRPQFKVTLRRTTRAAPTHMAVVPYNGAVFCVAVPNQTLYVRRNGRPVWSGNSRPVLYDDSPPAKEQPAQEQQVETPPDRPGPNGLVAGRFAGDLSLSSYL